MIPHIFDESDKQFIRESTQARIALHTRAASFMFIVNEVLSTFDGKKITKRIATNISKKLPEGYNVVINDDYSWFDLKIWGKEIGYDGMNISLGYKDRGPFNYYEWKNTQLPRFDYAHWIRTSSEALADLDNLIDNHNRAARELIACDSAMDGLVIRTGKF